MGLLSDVPLKAVHYTMYVCSVLRVMLAELPDMLTPESWSIAEIFTTYLKTSKQCLQDDNILYAYT